MRTHTVSQATREAFNDMVTMTKEYFYSMKLTPMYVWGGAVTDAMTRD